MLLTLSTTDKIGTDIGYLLHKNPNRLHEYTLSFGKARVFYPKASQDECQVALLVEINPVELAQKTKRNISNWSLGKYINDRPYVASSFLSTAIAKVFGTAMNGRCTKKPELVHHKIDLKIKLPVILSSGGEIDIHKIFEPLGYHVETHPITLNGNSGYNYERQYFSLELKIKETLQLVLSHLYLLIPTLDANKHYYVTEAEIEKLLEKGKSWLSNHPEKEWITRRILKSQGKLTKKALEKLTFPRKFHHEVDEEEYNEKNISLHELRHQSVTDLVNKLNIQSILDMGCGDGKLLKMLLDHTSIKSITGMDVSCSALKKAHNYLHIDSMPPLRRQRIKLTLGSLLYRDKRMQNIDAITLIEVIEHLNPSRLKTMERVIFEMAAPKHVIITTPNCEYNIKMESLDQGKFRHSDHRFEWTRAQCEEWGTSVGKKFNYSYKLSQIGPIDEVLGAPTQMILFTKK